MLNVPVSDSGEDQFRFPLRRGIGCEAGRGDAREHQTGTQTVGVGPLDVRVEGVADHGDAAGENRLPQPAFEFCFDALVDEGIWLADVAGRHRDPRLREERADESRLSPAADAHGVAVPKEP